MTALKPCVKCGVFHTRNVACFVVDQTARATRQAEVQAAHAVTAVSLLAKPLRREVMACGDAWLWHVTARESVSGALVEVGHVAGQAADVPRLSKELASAAPHGYHVFAVIVEPTPP